MANADTTQPVNVGVDSNPPPTLPPSLEPATPAIGASKALLHQLEALRQSEGLQQQQQAIVTAEGRRREWLQSNPIAQKFYDRLGAFHNEAIQSGLADTSPDYFKHLESRVAALHSQQPTIAGAHLIQEMQQRTPLQQPRPAPERPRTNIVSAPVSRGVPTGSSRENGKITLTNEQKEFARISGVSEVEYGRQLLRLNVMKDSGEYSDRR